MAERDPGVYDGAVAIDATLQMKEEGSQLGLSLAPQFPCCF